VIRERLRGVFLPEDIHHRQELEEASRPTVEEKNRDSIGFTGKEGNKMDLDSFTGGRIMNRSHVLRERVDLGFILSPFKEKKLWNRGVQVEIYENVYQSNFVSQYIFASRIHFVETPYRPSSFVFSYVSGGSLASLIRTLNSSIVQSGILTLNGVGCKVAEAGSWLKCDIWPIEGGGI